MPNPPGPDRNDASNAAGLEPEAVDDGGADRVASESDPVEEQTAASEADDVTEAYPRAGSDVEPATEVMSQPGQESPGQAAQSQRQRGERRFTAPGFDAKETVVMDTAAEPATEVFRAREHQSKAAAPLNVPPKTATPQLIPPRLGAKLRPSTQRSWGWVLALILIILALSAVAVLGTVLLTRSKHHKASQEEQVRTTIQNFDVAVQTGDLSILRSITCGSERDGYVNYDEQAWHDTYRKVAAAKQFPVVASIDQVVVNGEHAEANVTAFMANAPQVRSTRSFDLQFRDDQWKICQSSSS
ncbi:Rv0361 family membrane protein [Mycobacterium noviomagense]|uniref:Membrane protein n=1 Tax=Mycobacterium noviomagense TaxID=459858 RepID=A0A7I7PE66_9MYCO|nr:hypothetical protein [Mycobacterium noviomagense]ORB12749.1 hypothetical protein BST37_15245 [Mycobacterium noviomagense]BBY06825.1 membrane protein [Mycobacterium noviomagense]